MSVKLLTEHFLEVLSLKGGCTGSSESTRVKMPHCWKSHATAHIKVSEFYQEMPCNYRLQAYPGLCEEEPQHQARTQH